MLIIKEDFAYDHLSTEEKIGIEKYGLLAMLTETIEKSDMGYTNIDKIIGVFLNLVELYDTISNEEKASITDIKTPSHYSGKVDVISFHKQTLEPDTFVHVMLFNALKYVTRLGKKDEDIKELKKIYHYLACAKDEIENINNLGETS